MYRNILVAIDLDDESSWARALPTAVACCQAFGARLTLITVVPEFGSPLVAQQFPKDHAGKAVAAADEMLAEFIEVHVPADVEARRIVARGSIHNEILDAGKAIGADLLVMAAHKPGIRDYLLGATAYRVVRHFPGSVMVARG